MYNELLWIFTQLPDDYIVVDTETTGLPNENGLPDIVTLGITVVRNREIAKSVEFETRPQKRISEEAQSIIKRQLTWPVWRQLSWPVDLIRFGTAMEDSLCRVNNVQINKSGYIWDTESHTLKQWQLQRQVCQNARLGA